MNFEVKVKEDWVLFSISDRLDSFSHDDFTQAMEKALSDGKRCVALDLGRTRFLSMPTIKYVSNIAERLSHNGGRFALLRTPEKLKRQIQIFASLKPMLVFRSQEDWEKYSTI